MNIKILHFSSTSELKLPIERRNKGEYREGIKEEKRFSDNNNNEVDYEQTFYSQMESKESKTFYYEDTAPYDSIAGLYSDIPEKSDTTHHMLDVEAESTDTSDTQSSTGTFLCHSNVSYNEDRAVASNYVNIMDIPASPLAKQNSCTSLPNISDEQTLSADMQARSMSLTNIRKSMIPPKGSVPNVKIASEKKQSCLPQFKLSYDSLNHNNAENVAAVNSAVRMSGVQYLVPDTSNRFVIHISNEEANNADEPPLHNVNTKNVDNGYDAPELIKLSACILDEVETNSFHSETRDLHISEKNLLSAVILEKKVSKKKDDENVSRERILSNLHIDINDDEEYVYDDPYTTLEAGRGFYPLSLSFCPVLLSSLLSAQRKTGAHVEQTGCQQCWHAGHSLATILQSHQGIIMQVKFFFKNTILFLFHNLVMFYLLNQLIL